MKHESFSTYTSFMVIFHRTCIICKRKIWIQTHIDLSDLWLPKIYWPFDEYYFIHWFLLVQLTVFIFLQAGRLWIKFTIIVGLRKFSEVSAGLIKWLGILGCNSFENLAIRSNFYLRLWLLWSFYILKQGIFV